MSTEKITKAVVANGERDRYTELMDETASDCVKYFSCTLTPAKCNKSCNRYIPKKENHKNKNI